MSLNSCPFCEQGNPADAKICSACGGALTGRDQATMQRPTVETAEQSGDSAKRTLVIVLPEGGADVPDPASASADMVVVLPEGGADVPDPASASTDMVIVLPEGGADVPDPAAASAETLRPLSRPPMRLTAGVWAARTAALAVLAIFGYQVYKMLFYAEFPFEKAPLSTAVSGEVKERREAGASGTIGRNAAAGDMAPAKADDSAQPTSPATLPPETPLAGPTRAAANQPRADRQPVESRETKVTAAPIARPQVIDAGKAGRQKLSRPEACTESIASLGLCTPESVQTKEAETAAASKAPDAVVIAFNHFLNDPAFDALVKAFVEKTDIVGTDL